MYGKLFESMYDGTLYGQWEAIVTLQQMVVLADEQGVVDMTPQALAARTSIPIKIIHKGLSDLAKPDPHSRTPTLDGKRIVLIDSDRPWGWVVVNYDYYRHLASREDKKIKDRKRMSEKRNKNNNVATCSGESPDVADVADTNTNTDTNTKRGKAFSPPSIEQITTYCKERNNSIDSEQFHDFYQSKNWMVGKNKMKDWKAAVRTWEKRDREKPQTQEPKMKLL